MKKIQITLLVLAHRRDIINKTRYLICEDSQNDVKKLTIPRSPNIVIIQ